MDEGVAINAVEEGRAVRVRKKNTEPVICPVCGITIRDSEIEQHFALEMDRLESSGSSSKPRKSLERNGCAHLDSPGSSNAASSSQSSPPSSSSKGSNKKADSTWTTYQKIKNNRQARLKLKSRKRKNDENICPVCNKTTLEDIQLHVEQCLRRSEKRSRQKNSDGEDQDDSSQEDDSIDIEGETFEEYEWGGETRIRASSLLSGGYSSLGIGSNSGNTSSQNAENDEDLNVDGDDTQIYGPAQFSERDVILPSGSDSSEGQQDKYLRSLVIGEDPDSTIKRSPKTNNHQIEDSDDEMPLDQLNASGDQIVECLKAKIREYEATIRNKCNKCQICMDEYKNPTVSICCWHVHCEECWLKTLGVRKLCPKCNMITSPSDLRRIYL